MQMRRVEGTDKDTGKNIVYAVYCLPTLGSIIIFEISLQSMDCFGRMPCN